MTKNLTKTKKNTKVPKGVENKLPTKRRDTNETGTPTKKAATLLQKLKEDFAFEPAHEFMMFLNDQKMLFEELGSGILQPEIRRTIQDRDIDLYVSTRAVIADILKQFMRYCYPSLKSSTVERGAGEPINLNLFLGATPREPVQDAEIVQPTDVNIKLPE